MLVLVVSLCVRKLHLMSVFPPLAVVSAKPKRFVESVLMFVAMLVRSSDKFSPAKAANVKRVMQVLLRLDANRAAGDRFGNGAFQTRAHLYCGSEVIQGLLKSKSEFEKVHGIARAVTESMQTSGTFSALCRRVSAVKAPGLTTHSGYWTAHFCRLWLKDFMPMGPTPGTILLDSDGVEILLGMGEGAQSLKQLGVGAAELPGFCQLVERVCRAAGCDVQVPPANMIVTACESSRRGTLKGLGAFHREGFGGDF